MTETIWAWAMWFLFIASFATIIWFLFFDGEESPYE
jgi:hypothetical protein